MSGSRAGAPRLHHRVEPSLPPLAWVARIRDGHAAVICGSSVRTFDGGIFEGTWVGPPDASAVPSVTTVYGSGIVETPDGLLVITPSHHLEGIYRAQTEHDLVVSNSLVGVLEATGLEIDDKFNYSALFTAASSLCWLIDERGPDGVLHLKGSQLEIPMRNATVKVQFYENFAIQHDGSVLEVRKPRERPFTSFDEYRERLTEATRSALANATGYQPLLSLSSGYDSTAIAVVYAQLGCREAVGLRTSRPSAQDGSFVDSGVAAADRFGLDYTLFDRFDYQKATDVGEAEFLANGMAGEEIIFKAFEERLDRACLLTGYWAGIEWAMPNVDAWRHGSPTTTAGASMIEFRLRRDFYHVPIAIFGSVWTQGKPSILDEPEMARYRVGGHYDRPIPRRIAEDAGMPRGSFGKVKRAANVLFHRDGPQAFSDAGRASLEAYAQQQGGMPEFHFRRQTARIDRAIIRAAEALRLNWIVRAFDRRRFKLSHFEPEFGNFVFRWAVDVMRQRYRAAAPAEGDAE